MRFVDVSTSPINKAGLSDDYDADDEGDKRDKSGWRRMYQYILIPILFSLPYFLRNTSYFWEQVDRVWYRYHDTTLTSYNDWNTSITRLLQLHEPKQLSLQQNY